MSRRRDRRLSEARSGTRTATATPSSGPPRTHVDDAPSHRPTGGSSLLTRRSLLRSGLPALAAAPWAKPLAASSLSARRSRRNVVKQADDIVLGVSAAFSGASRGLGTELYRGAMAYFSYVAKLRLRDYRDYGEHRTPLFREKRGKEREIPVRFDLDDWIWEYLVAADAVDDPPESMLFRAMSSGAHRTFNPAGLGPWTIRQLLKRCLRHTGLASFITPHSFRALVVTDLLEQKVPLEEVQYLVGHSRPSTTQIYDRRQRKVTRNLVERISV